MHLCADGNGLPLGVVITPGEAHETTALDELTAIVDAKPNALIGDRAYDGDCIRADLLLHGIEPVIPARRRRTNPPPERNRKLYRERNRIEMV